MVSISPLAKMRSDGEEKMRTRRVERQDVEDEVRDADVLAFDVSADEDVGGARGGGEEVRRLRLAPTTVSRFAS